MLSDEQKLKDKELREYGVDLIEVIEGEIRVRWDVYNRWETNARICRKMNSLLLSLGIFSKRMEGNWIVLVFYIIANVCVGSYYFTREKDAISYLEEAYGKAVYRSHCKALYVGKIR